MHAEGRPSSLKDQRENCRLRAEESCWRFSPARLVVFIRAARQLAECRVQSNRREPAQLFPTVGGRRSMAALAEA
jgi:hypothetical protein